MTDNFLRSLNFNINVLMAEWAATNDKTWQVDYNTDTEAYSNVGSDSSLNALVVIDYMRVNNLTNFLKFELRPMSNSYLLLVNE